MKAYFEHPPAENKKGNDLLVGLSGIESIHGHKAATFAAPGVVVSQEESVEFESKQEAFKFYKEYATSVGFSAIIKASRRSRISGKFIDAKFVCTMFGSRRSVCSQDPEPKDGALGVGVSIKKKRGRTNRSWSKTDCKACMHVKRRQDGKWTISSFVKEHNHDLVADRGGQRNTKSCGHKKSSCSSSGGPHVGFRDGDAQAMLDYFSSMQDENPYFFYAVDLNGERVLRNVFWVHAKGRIDYSYFADVVLMDTACVKNGFRLPIVSFIGMNNHFQSVLLGCAFVGYEGKSTYAWAVRAWLRSMHGQAPKVMLTDQDPVLKEAIAEALPDSRHCFCLPHILSKVKEKLHHVIRQQENFIDKFHKCILKSQTEAQFEKRWLKLVDRFDLSSNEWIKSLYNDRLRWVPTFMKDIFFNGLCSVQCLESVTSPLDKCLQRKTTLKEFLNHYNIVLQEKYEDETKADLDTWHRQPRLKSPSPYEKQMVTVYTKAVFKKFQIEVLGAVACHPKKENKDDQVAFFKVQDFEKNQVCIVNWDEKTYDASCTCRLFEYEGFLCRHLLTVLQISGVNNIPEKYILRRWTKDAKCKLLTQQEDWMESKNQRYYELCRLACDLVDEGSLCQEMYSMVSVALEETLRKCEDINSSVQTFSPIE